MKFYTTNLNFAKSLMQMLTVIEHIATTYCPPELCAGGIGVKIYGEGYCAISYPDGKFQVI